MIEPALHRVLVRPQALEQVTESGIVLAMNERTEKAGIEKGTVLKVGQTAFKDYGLGPEFLKEGDEVVFARYAGKWIKDPKTNEELLFLNDEDIVGVIRND